jgi:hypothetical protein
MIILGLVIVGLLILATIPLWGAADKYGAVVYGRRAA